MTSLSRLVLVLFVLCPATLARCDDAAERLMLATYKLANEASTATGIVIRCPEEGEQDRLCVVTANHVLEQMNGDSCVLVARSRQDDGTFQRREIPVTIRRKGKNLWTKHADQDLAALPLPASVHVDALPWESLPTDQSLGDVHAGDAVFLAVFPERAEANSAGFPILRRGCIASYPLTPFKRHPMFLVDTTSWKGDSGGPVVHQSLRSPSGGPLVVGIVRGMRSITDTVKETRFVERRTDYPLGISEVLQAAFARELVAQAAAGE